MAETLLTLAALGLGFVAGAAYEHLRAGGTRDLTGRLLHLTQLRSVDDRARARQLIERGLWRAT